MKSTIKSLALVLAAALPAVVLAKSFGAALPASFTLEAGLGAFSLAFLGLILFAEYARPSRKLVTDLAATAPAARSAHGESHRLAA